MKKRYKYTLGEKQDKYTIDEIASTLDLDRNILVEYLEEYKDIESAIFQATKEKRIRKNIQLLLKNFTANYIVENGYSSVLKDYLCVSQKKSRLLKSIKKFDYDYLALTPEDLKLLLFNTEINSDKPIYSKKELEDYKALLNIANYKIDSKYINQYNQVIDCKIDLNFINNVKLSDFLCISTSNLKNIISFVQSHKLPKRYNERIMQEIVHKKNNNKMRRKSF